MGVSGQITLGNALNRVWADIFERDKRFFMIGEDIAAPGPTAGGVFGVSAGFLDRFGSERIINTPISESAFTGLAIGAAMCGMRPVVEIMFCDFLGVAFDPILSQMAKSEFLSAGRRPLPLILRTSMGAGDGSGAVHSQSLHALLASIPGLAVAVPSSPQAAVDVARCAAMCDRPVVIFEHKGLYGAHGQVDWAAPAPSLGDGQRLRAGGDISIVATGAMVPAALAAAEVLAEKGIEADVIDPVWISPWPASLVADSLANTGRLLVVDEGNAFIGFADGVISHMARNHWGSLRIAPRSVTPPHSPIPYAPELETKWLPGAEEITTAAIDMVRKG